MAESQNIVTNLTVNIDNLKTGLNQAIIAMSGVEQEAQKLKQITKEVFTKPTNTEALKTTYTDLQKEVAELNEKLLNEIALKKDTAKATADLLNAKTKEKEAIEKTATALKNQESQYEKSISTLKKFGAAILAAFAVRAIYQFSKTSIDEFAKIEKSEIQLLFSLNKNKVAYDNLISQANKLSGITIYRKDDIIAAQAFLATQKRSEDQIKKTIYAAMGLASVTGEDLQGAVVKLSATYEGNLGRLARMDGSLKTLTKEQLANGGAVDILGKKYAGLAEQVGGSTLGSIQRFKNTIKEIEEGIGERLVRGLGGIGSAFKNIVGWVKDFVEVPVEEKMELEKAKVNALTTSLLDQSKPQAQRLHDYNMLKNIAPEILNGINAENISVITLKNNLIKYNEEADKRIKRAGLESLLTKQAGKLADVLDFTANKMVEANEAAYELAGRLRGRGLGDEIDNLYNRMNSGLMTQDQFNKKLLEWSNFTDRQSKEYNKLNLATEELSQANEQSNKIQQINIETQKKYDEIMQDVLKSTEEQTGADGDGNDAKQAHITLLQEQRNKLAELKTLQEDQIGNTEELAATAAQISATEDLIAAEEQRIKQINERIKAQKAGTEAIQRMPRLGIGEIPTDAQIAKSVKEINDKIDKTVERENKTRKADWLLGLLGIDATGISQEHKQELERGIENLEKYAVSQAKNIADELLKIKEDQIDQELQATLKGLDAEEKSELDALKKKLDKKQITQKQYDDKEKQIQDRISREKNAAAKKAFESEKDYKKASILMNTAAAIIGFYASNTYPGGWAVATALAALLAIESGIQWANVDKQQYVPQYEKGGLIEGKSHPQGGKMINVEGGEYHAIFNKKIMSSREKLALSGTPLEIASTLNSMNGTGKPFYIDGKKLQGKAINSLFESMLQSNLNRMNISGDRLIMKVPETSNKEVKLSLNEIPEIRKIYNEIRKEGKTITYEGNRRVEKQNGHTRIILN